MIVRHAAFDELLDVSAMVEEEGEAKAEGKGASARRQFAMAVDRAVKKALEWSGDDGREWCTQTMKRYGRRLYFHRHEGILHLVACAPIE